MPKSLNTVKKTAATPRPLLDFKMTLLLDDELVGVIDEYRYKNKIPSRLETIRHLIRKGLDAK